MTPRDVFERRLRLLEVGDLEGLLGQYHEDAVLVGFDRVVHGRAALRDELARQLRAGVRVREVLQYAEADDVASWQEVLELGGEEVRGHGALLLHGERISRQVSGLFPAASGTGRGRGSAVQVDLEPYVAWTPRAVPDPRTAGRDAIGPVLLEIVNAEGPVLAERAYRLYLRASGGKALTTIARAPLSGAAFRLRQAGAIEFEGDDVESAGASVNAGSTRAEVLRMTGTPEVRVRELGARELHEVPLREIAELMRRLRGAGATALPRAVLDAYGLVRMTAKAEEYLGRAEELAG